MSRVSFGTKAETLERLKPLLRSAHILDLIQFTVSKWNADPKVILASIQAQTWGESPVIIRSSCRLEDQAGASHAGHFVSIAGVCGHVAMAEAIAKVIASYDADPDNQVLVQPMLTDITMSGVAFSRDPNTGAAYMVVNYEQNTGDTAAVTAGKTNDLTTFVCWKRWTPKNARMAAVAALLAELEDLLGQDSLDVEFGFDRGDTLYLLQVRPLVTRAKPSSDPATQQKLMTRIADKIAAGCLPHPFLHGDRTVYGIMPDWNPAEMIGIRPYPLAMSLYGELITNSTWAYQRHNYGYKNLRSFPLMVNFHGLPYIDVRVSFNSFIPRQTEDALASRLVNYYIDRLLSLPELHDKVEFDIVFSCYTLDLPDRLKILKDFGFTSCERNDLLDSLRTLTNRIINAKSGLWQMDSNRLNVLVERRRHLLSNELGLVTRIYWLLEDCKRYGTLPFAGLARAAFVAIQILQSLVDVGILNEEEKANFLAGLDTVGSRLTHDLGRSSKHDFLAEYGHLRPGTYDILSPRYDEAPNLYFDWDNRSISELKRDNRPFSLSLHQMREIERLLKAHGLDHDLVGLFDFLKASIEGREHAKFLFTRNVSDAISFFTELGCEHGFSSEDMAYANIEVIHSLYASTEDPKDLLRASIEHGRQRHAQTLQVCLPPLITRPEDVWEFKEPPSQPNFITQKSAVAPTRHQDNHRDLQGSIVMIPSADPGFDWIFSHGIAGFITAYGGVNSHMAIRASELGLPAVIGAGEQLYSKWSKAHVLRLDCANRKVDVLQ